MPPQLLIWNQFMYIIEGNIGAGKTTFLKLLEKHMPEVSIVDEPLDSWDNKEHGQSLLTHFYKDTPRWAFTMEMFTLMCRVKEHMKEQQRPIHKRTVMERSIYSGYYCFALNSYQQGFMSNLEWEIHKRWFTYLVHNKCKKPSGFFYLKTSANVAYERTKKRNRAGEETIPLSYLEQIEKRLDNFLINKKGLLPELKKVPVLVIECDQEFENDINRQQKMLQQIKHFFESSNNFVPAKRSSEKRSTL